MTTAEHLMSWNQLLLAIITFLTTIGGVLALVRKWIKTDKSDIENAFKNSLQTNADDLAKDFRDVDPNTYLTLDFRQTTGPTEIFVPLHRDIISRPLLGLRLRLVAAFEDSTEYEIDTREHPLPVRLPWHHHDGTESVTVIQGTLTDLHTGRIYRAGETWEITPGKPHHSEFLRAWCAAKMRPPLPNGTTRPIRLTNLPNIYDREPFSTP